MALQHLTSNRGARLAECTQLESRSLDSGDKRGLPTPKPYEVPRQCQWTPLCFMSKVTLHRLFTEGYCTHAKNIIVFPSFLAVPSERGLLFSM